MLAPSPAALVGHAKPRLAPPVPAHHALKEIKETAEGMGITLMPWQETASKYLTAVGPDGRHLYSEVAIVVARQQGKTTLMKPLIIRALRQGKRVMHIAQTRELPRTMFRVIAAELDESLFMKQRGKGGRMNTVWPRHGSGQEEILLANGGSYRIAAAGSGGARGWTNDLVIIDELREVDSWSVIDAAQPTLRMSDDGQMVYLSNAGHDRSVVLNAVRLRRDEDPNLAYLEWSAAPERRSDDRQGWAEANPAIGIYPSVLRDLEKGYQSAVLSGMMAGFETESLCRWVSSMRPLYVMPEAWAALEVEDTGTPRMPHMGIALDPDAERASVVLAWRMPDERVAMRVLLDVSSPINVDRLGTRLRTLVREHRPMSVGFDPLTDQQLARYLVRKPIPLGSSKHATASARFAELVDSSGLAWEDAAAVTADLAFTTKRLNETTGTFHAVRADEDRPITAALAAIRAVWLASDPTPVVARIQ